MLDENLPCPALPMGLHDDEMRQRLRSQTLQTGLQFEHATVIVLSTVPASSVMTARVSGPKPI